MGNAIFSSIGCFSIGIQAQKTISIFRLTTAGTRRRIMVNFSSICRPIKGTYVWPIIVCYGSLACRYDSGSFYANATMTTVSSTAWGIAGFEQICSSLGLTGHSVCPQPLRGHSQNSSCTGITFRLCVSFIVSVSSCNFIAAIIPRSNLSVRITHSSTSMDTEETEWLTLPMLALCLPVLYLLLPLPRRLRLKPQWA